MDILAQERNYIPIDIDTRYHSCLRRRDSGWPIRKILSFYHVKRASLYRWLSHFDGTRESLLDQSHKPKSDHPSKLGAETAERVLDLHRRNPGHSFVEIWAGMRHDGCEISASSVLRTLKRNDGYSACRPHPKKHDRAYHTPKMVHEKWQVDVKFVPLECNAPGLLGRSCQYTILDECPGKRILHFPNEHSMYETVNALKHAYAKIGCHPREIQTDNGFEFTDRASRNEKARKARPYPNYLEQFLRSVNVRHHLIRPRMPERGGKAGRSHRIDQDRFYRTLRFHSLDDLRPRGPAWNRRYNDMPKVVLGSKTPNEVELEKPAPMMEDTGEMRCPKRLTSIES